MSDQKITAWSYSRHTVFKQCPFKAKLLYIDKAIEPTNEAMERGSAIHKRIELYLKEQVDTLDGSVKTCRADIEELRSLRKNDATQLLVEHELAFKEGLAPSGWFDKDTWLRCKMDAVIVTDKQLTVIDFKTGKVRDSHEEQAELYAVAASTMAPLAAEIRVKYMYLDSGDIITHKYMRNNVDKLTFKWVSIGQDMCSKTEFPKRPSKLCAWCDFNADRQKLCTYK